MSRWICLLSLLILSLLGVQPAQAQDKVQIGTLEIALWPEYDQPSVLVIYRLTLSDAVILPKQLALRIPASAGRPHAVAVREPSGQLVNLEYDLTSDGTWITLKMIANFPELQIEYYDPGLLKEGAQRTFTFEWSGDYAVERCFVEVQQPLSAERLTISPGPVASNVAADGLVYFTKEVGALSAGQTFKIEVSYQKDNDNLSISALQVQPSAPLTTESSWQDRMLGALPWLLGIGGVLLIAGGVFWYWQSGRQPRPPRRRRGRAQRVSAVEAEASSPGSGVSAVYCHQCGKRAAEGDRYCRSCGTRLRVE